MRLPKAAGLLVTCSPEWGLERDFIRIWSLSPKVVALVAQPVQSPFTTHNGRDYIHTSDFFVQFDDELNLKPQLVSNLVGLSIKSACPVACIDLDGLGAGLTEPTEEIRKVSNDM